MSSQRSSQLQPDSYFGLTRVWTRDNVENFVRYAAAAILHDESKSELAAYAKSIEDGLPHQIQGESIEPFLLFQMERTVFNNRRYDKPSDPRALQTIFHNGQATRSLGNAADNLYRARMKALEHMDGRTRDHMLSMYADMLKTIRINGRRITEYKLEISKVQHETEVHVKNALEILFSSLANRKDDCIVTVPALDAYMKRNFTVLDPLFNSDMDHLIKCVPNSSFEEILPETDATISNVPRTDRPLRNANQDSASREILPVTLLEKPGFPILNQQSTEAIPNTSRSDVPTSKEHPPSDDEGFSPDEILMMVNYGADLSKGVRTKKSRWH